MTRGAASPSSLTSPLTRRMRSPQVDKHIHRLGKLAPDKGFVHETVTSASLAAGRRRSTGGAAVAGDARTASSASQPRTSAVLVAGSWRPQPASPAASTFPAAPEAGGLRIQPDQAFADTGEAAQAMRDRIWSAAAGRP